MQPLFCRWTWSPLRAGSSGGSRHGRYRCRSPDRSWRSDRSSGGRARSRRLRRHRRCGGCCWASRLPRTKPPTPAAMPMPSVVVVMRMSRRRLNGADQRGGGDGGGDEAGNECALEHDDLLASLTEAIHPPLDHLSLRAGERFEAFFDFFERTDRLAFQRRIQPIVKADDAECKKGGRSRPSGTHGPSHQRKMITLPWW